jgi:hypothetical protein
MNKEVQNCSSIGYCRHTGSFPAGVRVPMADVPKRLRRGEPVLECHPFGQLNHLGRIMRRQ